MLESLALCSGAVPVGGATCAAVSGLAGAGASAGANLIFSEAAQWVAGGAVWLIAQVGRAMSASTSIDLGAGWFRAHEAVMASLAAVVVLPMACCAAIQAVYRQSASMLLRTFLVQLPLSLLLTGVAVTLVRMALAATDAMSALVLSSGGVDTTTVFTGLFAFLTPAGLVTAGIVPGFVVLIGGLLVAAAAFVLWLELVVRAAAVSVAVLFLPLALAALVWPSVAHWCKRLADTLVALVLSKLVVAAVLSLTAGAIAGGMGSSAGGGGGDFTSVVTGIALLVIAVLSPFTLLRLVPAVESGAVAHLESARHRLKSAAATPVRAGTNLAVDQMNKVPDKAKSAAATSVGTAGAAGSVGTLGSEDGENGGGIDGGAGEEHGPGGGGGVGSSSGGGSGGGGAGMALVRGDPAMQVAFRGIQSAESSTSGHSGAGPSRADTENHGTPGAGAARVTAGAGPAGEDAGPGGRARAGGAGVLGDPTPPGIAVGASGVPGPAPDPWGPREGTGPADE